MLAQTNFFKEIFSESEVSIELRTKKRDTRRWLVERSLTCGKLVRSCVSSLSATSATAEWKCVVAPTRKHACPATASSTALSSDDVTDARRRARRAAVKERAVMASRQARTCNNGKATIVEGD